MLDQLELFQILNTEQQTEVNSFVERTNKQVVDRVDKYKENDRFVLKLVGL